MRTVGGWLVIGLAWWAGCASQESTGDDEGVLGALIPSVESGTPAEAARDVFNSYDADVRRRAIVRLSNSYFGGEPAYLEMYRLVLDDADPTVRAVCVRALGMHGSVDDAPRLWTMLDDEASTVRWEAAKALQRIHHEGAVRPLMERTQPKTEPDADVRQAAADALGQYPQVAVFDALVAALNDRDFGVVQAAKGSLVTLTGQEELDENPTRWLNWAADHRSNLFEGRRPYRFKPYPEPPSLLERAQFWKDREDPQPLPPKGLELEPGDPS